MKNRSNIQKYKVQYKTEDRDQSCDSGKLVLDKIPR